MEGLIHIWNGDTNPHPAPPQVKLMPFPQDCTAFSLGCQKGELRQQCGHAWYWLQCQKQAMQLLNQSEALFISLNLIELSLEKYFCFALCVLQFHWHLLKKKITTDSFLWRHFSFVKSLGQQYKFSGPPSFPKGALTFTGNYVWHLSHVSKMPLLL